MLAGLGVVAAGLEQAYNGFSALALNADGRPQAQALAPHPLDRVFDRATTEQDVTNGLLHNELFGTMR